MTKYIRLSLLAFLLGCSSTSMAWTPGGEVVTVDELWEWQDNFNIVFKTSLGHYCYIPPTEKNMYSLVLSLFATGNKASIHCNDTEENNGGVMAHRVHRVVSFRQ